MNYNASIAEIYTLQFSDVDSSYNDLIEKSKRQHLNISVLKGGWEDNIWYKQGLSIYFSYTNIGERGKHAKRYTLPKNLEYFAKAFVVSYISKNIKSGKDSENVGSYLKVMSAFCTVLKIKSVNEITQVHYEVLLQFLCTQYKIPESNISRLNTVIRFINKNQLVEQSIQVKKGNLFSERDSLGNLKNSNSNKLPNKDIVKAIIDLKHAIFSTEDEISSGRLDVDKLCILTQVFQFGMGLRITEVLRLPYDCVRYIENRPYLLVWTEKGQQPFARPIPAKWRDLILDAISVIKKLTSEQRKLAIEFEEKGELDLVNQRFNEATRKKEEIFSEFSKELNDLVNREAEISKEIWKLPEFPASKWYLDIFELQELNLPLIFSKKNIIDECETRGIQKEVILKKIHEQDTQRRRITIIRLEELRAWIERAIAYREEYITLKEFNDLLARSANLSCAKELLKPYIQLISVTYLNMKGVAKGRANMVPVKEALKVAKLIIYGGYDPKEWVFDRDLAVIFPELYSRGGTIEKFVTLKYEVIVQNIYVQHNGNGTTGFHYQKLKNRRLISRKSLQENLLNTFKANFLESNLGQDEKSNNSVRISSKSFSIDQNVSEFLFLKFDRQASSILVGDGLVPTIIKYPTVNFFFNGGEGYNGDFTPSAFEKYGIKTSTGKSITGHQTHGGRHWQTTSLFKAGAADYVVDLYMGRTPGQGRNYDHNTGSERAGEVKQLLLKETNRLLGPVADQVRNMRESKVDEVDISNYLDDLVSVAHWSPYGGCIRDIVLNPCPYSVRCLKGESGNGCKHLVIDKKDEVSIVKIIELKDKTEKDMERLFTIHSTGNVHVDKHITHNMNIIKNCENVLAEIDTVQKDGSTLYTPFPEGDSTETDPFLV